MVDEVKVKRNEKMGIVVAEVKSKGPRSASKCCKQCDFEVEVQSDSHVPHNIGFNHASSYQVEPINVI